MAAKGRGEREIQVELKLEEASKSKKRRDMEGPEQRAARLVRKRERERVRREKIRIQEDHGKKLDEAVPAAEYLPGQGAAEAVLIGLENIEPDPEVERSSMSAPASLSSSSPEAIA